MLALTIGSVGHRFCSSLAGLLKGRPMRLAFSTALSLMIVGFPFVSYGEEGSTLVSNQLSLLDAICTKVMGLNPGESYFAGCKKILSQSLVQKAQETAASGADHACSERGLAPGTAAFSTCVLDSENDPSLNVKDQTGTAYPDGANIAAGQSFYNVSFSVRWNRERYACASLGLIPNGAAFDQCVSGLDSSFLPSPN
jgi:hypothetical protein